MMNSIVCVTGGVCHALVGGWWGQMDKTMVESAESASQVVTETAAAAELAPADLVWVLISSALVLMMTAPGLALFYGGLVRKKNILSVMMQCISLMGVMSLVWVLLGYSLCFSGDAGSMGFIGDLGYAGLKGVMATFTGGTHDVPMEGAIPKLLHCIFQMMFFIITPALICGAFAERMTFRAMLAFCVLWGLIVYCPVAHWVWSGSGWCSEFNPQAVIKAYDFAGGTVVHITSGVSALICALLLGHRLGYGSEPMPPHNLSYTFIGATLLWVGWFGFNAGSALGANYSAVNAFMATHLSAAAGAIVWPLLEWIFRGKPSVLGACSGCVAGLVCVTPACGTCTPLGGIVLGACAGAVCYWACTSLKNQCGYDDTLDAFGVHGVGGTLGAILTGVFADPSVTGDAAKAGLLTGAPGQVVAQALAAGAAIVWSVVITAVILKVIDVTLGLRVPQAGELQGLDIHEHGEEGYIFL
ncbi:MAG: ammonium transporter [Planctomycetaceae bacterium]|nr:MAG: ammonium transporter [Planctomycetaceae bacterium]